MLKYNDNLFILNYLFCHFLKCAFQTLKADKMFKSISRVLKQFKYDALDQGLGSVIPNQVVENNSTHFGELFEKLTVCTLMAAQ